LQAYLAKRSPATLSIAGSPETVWPGTWTDEGPEIIRVDLAATGIPYTVGGKDHDFHALRHQFITNFAAAASLKAVLIVSTQT